MSRSVAGMEPNFAEEARITAVAPGAPEWDAFIGETAESTFCHDSGWRGIMEDVLGHQCTYLAARDGDGHWVGALPMTRVRSRLFGHYLVSMPFLNYGGPVGRPSARSQLASHAAAEARRTGADLLELRCRVPLDSELRLSHRKVAVLLDLPSAPETLWAEQFSAKLRSQIRRPRKEGMEARFGPEQVPAFYEVFARHMRDLGTPVLPLALFERIAAVFDGRVLFGAVYRGDEPVAAGCGFTWRDELEITWAAALREHARAAPNMLLYWAFIERAIEQGVRTFNFGRSTPGAGTHRFKLQWGGVDAPLPWLQWSRRGLAATPSPDGSGVFRLATAAWQRVPMPIARRLGPPLARRLP
jgi:serine/alanine adding enzyme